MYNNGNSSKNVTGSSVVDGTMESADYADNGLSGDKIDGGIISNFQSTGIDDRLPTGKVLTLSTTGAAVTGALAVNSGTTDTAATFTSSDASVAINFVASDNSMQIATSGTDGIIKNNGAGSFRFFNNGSEKVRILSSGGITFNGDTAAANALDDYEEGTWTGVITDGTNNATMGTTIGNYVKVGRNVSLSAHIGTTSLGSVTGNIYITGLPFVNSTGTTYRCAAAIGYSSNLAITAGRGVTAWVEGGQVLMQLNVWDSTTGTTAMQATEWSSNGSVMISLTYIAA